MADIKIAGTLHNSEDIQGDPLHSHVVARADEILDEAKGKKQSVFNQQTEAKLDTHETRLNGYTQGKFVTVSTREELVDGIGATDTIYRVSNYDGSVNSGQGAVDVTKYSEYAWDGTRYVFLSVKTQIGEVFDISEYNAGAVYADLDDALSNNHVPAAVRRGGMSVKFLTEVTPASYTVVKTEGLDDQPAGTELSVDPGVDSGTYDEDQLGAFSTLPASTGAGNAVTYWMEVAGDPTTYTKWVITMVHSSDNNYVQYRYMKSDAATSATFTNTENWQGVDAYPSLNSKNLVDGNGISLCVEDSKLVPELFESVDNPTITDDSYIDRAGNIQQSGAFAVYSFPVNQGAFVMINHESHVSDIVLSYAFYNSSTFNESTLVSAGPIMSINERDILIVQVPRGATYIAVSRHNVSSYIFELATATSDAICYAIPKLRNLINHSYASLESQIGAKPNYIDISFEEYQEVESVGSVDNVYIKSDGRLVAANGFIAYAYPVTPGDIVKVHCTLNAGASCAYAFYSSNQYSQATAVLVGPSVTSYVDNSTVEVPSNAAYILIQTFRSEYGLQKKVLIPVKVYVEEIMTEIDDIQNAISPLVGRRYLYNDLLDYSFDGNNLYLAWNNGNGKEYVYWFKKCMANELFTFYMVGYRNVDRIEPDASSIDSDTNIVVINQTASDNIGPIRMEDGGFVGGNHTYNNGSVKTAETQSFNIMADGKTIQSGDSGYVKDISILVHNIIYDPAVAPSAGAEILSTKLCDEYALYVVKKNTIEVALSHKFVDSTENIINTYYGMQSMFVDDVDIMTPNGNYSDWASAESVSSFTKSAFQNFNRFIEKSITKNVCQSSYLSPVLGLGSHSLIGNSSNIFLRSGGKCYHHLIENQAAANLIAMWKGCYTFFTTPVQNDNDVLIYTGIIDGKDAVYINTKRAFTGIVSFPRELSLLKFDVIERIGIDSNSNDSGINVGCGLYITCNDAGSLILRAI